MDSDQLEQIRNAYHGAAEKIGLPEGWFVQVETLAWAYEKMEGFGVKGFDEFSNVAAPMVVNENGVAHIVAEHEGPVKQVHARRYLEEGIEDHRTE
jgi:hypothetical protein